MPAPKDPIKYKQYCERISKSLKEKFKDPNHRKKHHDGLVKAASNQEWRKNISDKMKIICKGSGNPMYGKTPWNKGLPLSDQTRIKLSNSLKKTYSNPDIRKKISNSRKGKYKGEENHNYGRVFSEEYRKKLSDAQTGEKSVRWKGGISFIPYCPKFTKHRKKAVRDFFENKCLCCGSESIEKLSVHHIDHNKNQGCDGIPFNLVPFCRSCHGKENTKPEEYKKYINKTLEEGFKWGIWSKNEYEEKVMY